MQGKTWNYGKNANRAWNISNPAVDPCSNGWFGVTCAASTEGSKLISLQLPSMYTSCCFTSPSSCQASVSCPVSPSIPTQIGLLTALTKLDLTNNSLVGAIPTQISDLTRLESISLGLNSFTGIMPELRVPRLTYFTVGFSSLNGPFPSWLINCTAIQWVDLLRNNFFGPIPDRIWKLTTLTYLGLDKNAFDGTVPSALGTLTRLKKLAINGNKLEGTLPATLGQISSLTYLGVHQNSLSGQIPDMLFWPNLVALRANDNLFTGTVPFLNVSSRKFHNLDLFNNSRIHGSLPSYLSGLYALTRLDLSNLSLTGPFPSYLLNDNKFVNLQYLSLHHNALTGSLAGDLPRQPVLPFLRYLYTQDNNLTGTIPLNFGYAFPQLSSVLLSGNSLSGSLPLSISNMTILSILKVDGNKLTSGDTFASAAFLSPRQPVAFLGLSSNNFGGTIPAQLFDNAPKLETIALSSNCFSGGIPYASICNRPTISYLIMDGLAAGPSCTKMFISPRYFQTVRHKFNGSYQLRKIKGEFSDCLFRSLPALKSVHLSGNGLTGDIQKQAPLPVNLTQLFISNNKIHGTLPPTFHLQKGFSVFDLSYNLLEGALREDLLLTSGATFRLQLNYLSGALPLGVLQSAGSVEILRGNLFSCADRRELPRNDPWIDSFQCGSIGFDKYVYALLGILCATIAFLAWGIKDGALILSFTGTGTSIFSFKKMEGVGNREFRDAIMRHKHVMWFGRILLYTRKIGLVLAGVIILSLMPLYGILSATSGSYLYSYSWTLSGIFKKGKAPAAVLLVWWSALIILPSALIRHYFEDDFEEQRKDKIEKRALRRAELERTGKISPQSNSNHSKRWFRLMHALLFLRLIFIVSVNCLTTLAANIFYVLYSTTMPHMQVFLKLFLSTFKLFWNLHVLRYLCRQDTVNRIAALIGATQEEMKEATKHYAILKGASIFELSLLLFNNIVAPCLATAVVDPECFFHLFYALPPVFATYFVLDCPSSPKYSLSGVVDPTSVKTNCFPRVTTSSYSPAFAYRNKCTSVLIQNYAPVLILVALWPSFVRPLRDYLLRKLLDVREVWGWPLPVRRGAGEGEGRGAGDGGNDDVENNSNNHHSDENAEKTEKRKSSEDDAELPLPSESSGISSADLERVHEAEMEALWNQRKPIYFYLLKTLRSRMLWNDREFAMADEADEFYTIKEAVLATASDASRKLQDALQQSNMLIASARATTVQTTRSISLQIRRYNSGTSLAELEPEATGREGEAGAGPEAEKGEGDGAGAGEKGEEGGTCNPLHPHAESEAPARPPAPTRWKPSSRYTFVDVPRYFLEADTDLVSLMTFGLVCPLLAVAQAVSIASRALQWQTMIRHFVGRYRSRGAAHNVGDRGRNDASPTGLPVAAMLHQLDVDCSVIYGGANPVKARWVLTVLPTVFLSFFLLDMAAQDMGTRAALWAPLLFCFLPLSLILCGGEQYVVNSLRRKRSLHSLNRKHDNDNNNDNNNNNNSSSSGVSESGAEAGAGGDSELEMTNKPRSDTEKDDEEQRRFNSANTVPGLDNRDSRRISFDIKKMLAGARGSLSNLVAPPGLAGGENEGRRLSVAVPVPVPVPVPAPEPEPEVGPVIPEVESEHDDHSKAQRELELDVEVNYDDAYQDNCNFSSSAAAPV